jgi:hypothetical protein
MVTLEQGSTESTTIYKPYVVEFLCRDEHGALEVGEPTVTLLKDR